MKFSIEQIRNSDIVYAVWEGPITGEERHEFRDKIGEKCEEIGSKKFIVDLRKQENTTGIKDNYEFGKQLRRKMPGFSIAAIYNKLGFHEDVLTETVMRGDVNLQRFNDFDSALAWLKDQ